MALLAQGAVGEVLRNQEIWAEATGTGRPSRARHFVGLRWPRHEALCVHQDAPQVIGRLSMRVVIEALMTKRDLPDAEPVQQLLDVGLIEPDDPAVRSGSVEKPSPQRGEIDLSVHHGVEHIGEMAPLADASSQCPLGPAARTGVVLLDPRTRAATAGTSAIETRQEAFLSAPGTAAAAADGL